MNLEQLRREYLQGGLRHKDLPVSPHALFERWLEQAISAALPDPTAMVVATVDADGQPSQRIVLLKQQDEAGFVFYTNYDSRKGHELRDNDRISLLFPWHSLERQVKVSGRARKVSQEESQHYFASRPRDSQLAAWASHQSSEIRSRDYLIQQLELMRERFGTEDVPLPDYWGGFRVVPHAVEFWQGGAHRLHDRFAYRLEADASWSIHRLSP